MSSKFIAKYNYNDREFFICLNKNMKIIAYYLDKDNNICFNLNKDEVSVVKEILRNILIDKDNCIYVKDEYLNDKIYKIFCDTNNNYFWISNTFRNDSVDNAILNMKYNNMPDILYSYDDYEDYFKKNEKTLEEEFESNEKAFQEEMDEFFKYAKEDLEEWFRSNDNIFIPDKIKYKYLYYNNDNSIKDRDKYYRRTAYLKKKREIKSIFVNIVAHLALLGAVGIVATKIDDIIEIETQKEEFDPQISIVETITEEDLGPTDLEQLKNEIETIEETEYTWEVIKQAIESNPNITSEEKNFLYKLQFVFDENYKYMDLDLIITRLETLKILYGQETENFNWAGSYNFVENTIEHYRADSFEEVEIRTFLHEFFHVLQDNTKDNKFYELSNEIFTRETIRRLEANNKLKVDETESLGYTSTDEYFYYLAELFDEETLKRYQFNCKSSILYPELENSKDRDSYYNAVRLLDLVDNAVDESLNSFWGIISDETREEILNLVNYFHELKYGVSMEGNINYFPLNLKFHTDLSTTKGSFVLKMLDKTDYQDYSDNFWLQNRTQMKTYFSDAFPNTIIDFEWYPKSTSGNGLSQKILDKNEKLLKSLGEYDESYSIELDEGVEKAYQDYLSTTSKTK